MPRRRAHSISPKQLDTLLAYLPIFENSNEAGKAIVEMVEGEVVHYDNYGNEVNNFLRDFRDGAFLLSFDWQQWDFKATPQTIAAAGLPNLMKELTRCVQRDRLKLASFKEACESGHITLILRRLQQIRQGMNSEDVVCISYTPI